MAALTGIVPPPRVKTGRLPKPISIASAASFVAGELIGVMTAGARPNLASSHFTFFGHLSSTAFSKAAAIVFGS